MTDEDLFALAEQLTKEYFPCSMEIGKIIDHPDGYKVKVVSGRYMGTYGLSNYWTWRQVLKDKTLGPEISGYGW